MNDTLPVTPDTTRQSVNADTIVKRVERSIYADSFSKKPVVKVNGWKTAEGIPLQYQVLRHHPYFGFAAEPVSSSSNERIIEGKEDLFYVIVGIVLLFALFRLSFPKYFSDLFRLFFRTTLKQRQIREQLIQTPLPSLLLNGFYVIVGGLYINFLVHYYGVQPFDNFWLLFVYCMVGLTVIYLGKFAWLKIAGFIFGVRSAADSYIFIVFIINKVIGIFLLPFVIILAFTSGQILAVALVLSWVGIAGLFFYRFILTFAAIRNQVRFNIFHFLLYFIAFEVAPLLLIYKGLLVLFD